jgi:hypothetical protein
MHLTVYNIKVFAYEAKLFYRSLFRCISRGNNCFTCLKMAESAFKKKYQCPLAAGLKEFQGTVQRSIRNRPIPNVTSDPEKGFEPGVM